MPRIRSTMSKQPSLLSKLWQDSQTKALAYGQAIAGTVLFSASQLNGLFTDSTFSSALNALSLPHWFPFVLVGLALLTYLAHGRKDA